MNTRASKIGRALMLAAFASLAIGSYPGTALADHDHHDQGDEDQRGYNDRQYDDGDHHDNGRHNGWRHHRNWDENQYSYGDDRYAYQLQREQAQRRYEWQTRNRVYYGEHTYVTPPPTVYYAPPPPPSGLNLLFNFGR